MSNSEPDCTRGEAEGLRQALEAETRKRLEIQDRLEAAEAEFEAFISMAAHNLREPLRDVASFSQLLAESCAGRLDSEATSFLERIREGAARMQSLLADVVDYWVTATDGRQPTRTDMDAVLSQALLAMDKLIKERGAIVTHDPLPAVLGDFEILAKVLRHLIENAVEYGTARRPGVHVSSTRVGSDWRISVKDNGPGIEPAFTSRLFSVFKRLHGREHPGNGLGLAFCKKAIERQGGKMSLESTPGEGSTFSFTLPPADPD